MSSIVTFFFAFFFDCLGSTSAGILDGSDGNASEELPEGYSGRSGTVVSYLDAAWDTTGH
mgnify:CR=1 FL=1